MKCNICGSESGNYQLCKVCNAKKNSGEIIKCNTCGQWHFKEAQCPVATASDKSRFLYELQRTLITKSEQMFFNAIKNSVPEGYQVFPQINLAAFIQRTDNARFHNELFRNVDFLITDDVYAPKIVIEINDQTHLTRERRERDEKVQNICEEAGIPIMKLWTSYGVNTEYIKGKIDKILNTPVIRKHHSLPQQSPSQESQSDVIQHTQIQKTKQGCYIASCVYGSYDCPKVWVLRRYRDNCLNKTWYGKVFIKIYYFISPTIVKLFGKRPFFSKSCRKMLDAKIENLKNQGYNDTPYTDTY